MNRSGDGQEGGTALESPDPRRLGLALLEEAGGVLGRANSKERWGSYAEVPARLSALIPLPSISLQQLLTLKPGTMLVSEWQLSQDMPLMVGEVFLANVSCEPAGDRLGVRINGFDRPVNGL